jgi:hypothetical protein
MADVTLELTSAEAIMLRSLLDGERIEHMIHGPRWGSNHHGKMVKAVLDKLGG